jgi:hypothetical protein
MSLAVAVTLVTAAPEAVAQPFMNDRGNRGEMQSLDSILGNIRRDHPGQLSDVEGPRNGRYIIKWLTPDGRVLWLETDARTGQVVGVRGGGDNFQRQSYEPAPTFFPRNDAPYQDRPFGDRFDRPNRNDRDRFEDDRTDWGPGGRVFRQDR